MFGAAFKVFPKEPRLLADYALAYGGLLAETLEKGMSTLAVRAGLYAAAAVLCVIGAAWLGMALLLIAALPESSNHRWVLLVFGAAPFAAAGLLFVIARQRVEPPLLATLRSQLKKDVAVLKEVQRS